VPSLVQLHLLEARPGDAGLGVELEGRALHIVEQGAERGGPFLCHPGLSVEAL
jgi:hypothetical protein